MVKEKRPNFVFRTVACSFCGYTMRAHQSRIGWVVRQHEQRCEIASVEDRLVFQKIGHWPKSLKRVLSSTINANCAAGGHALCPGRVHIWPAAEDGTQLVACTCACHAVETADRGSDDANPT